SLRAVLCALEELDARIDPCGSMGCSPALLVEGLACWGSSAEPRTADMRARALSRCPPARRPGSHSLGRRARWRPCQESDYAHPARLRCADIQAIATMMSLRTGPLRSGS